MLKISVTALMAAVLASGLSPIEVARRAGVDERKVSHLLNHGGSRCHFRTVYRLAQALNVQPLTLVVIEEGVDD